jgi:hypothetical protein
MPSGHTPTDIARIFRTQSEQQYMLNEIHATLTIMRQDYHLREELQGHVRDLTGRAERSNLENLDRIRDVQAVQRDFTQAQQGHLEAHNGFQYQLAIHTDQLEVTRNNLNTINALLTQALLGGASSSNEATNGALTQFQAAFTPIPPGISPHNTLSGQPFPSLSNPGSHTNFTPSGTSTGLFLPTHIPSGPSGSGPMYSHHVSNGDRGSSSPAPGDPASSSISNFAHPSSGPNPPSQPEQAQGKEGN